MFLWHFPSARAARPLAGTLSGGVPTFLPRKRPGASPPATVRSPVPPYCRTGGGPSAGMTCRSAGGSSTTQRLVEATPSTS